MNFKTLRKQLLPPALVASWQQRGDFQGYFGGGMGLDYIHVNTSLPRRWDIPYQLIESPRVCETGATLWTGDEQIHFYSFLPKDLPVDIF